MNKNNVWLITGAGRGLGLDIAKAALAAGKQIVATGRDPEKVQAALGVADNLLVVPLDVTNPQQAEAAARAAIDHFGQLDVLVNNAASCFIGFFEELTPSQLQTQFNTNFFGPLNVTRAVLPYMRAARKGHIISISSTAGFIGYEYCSAYAASKFALEGWMESLDPEVAPLGIHTTIVEPGFFRTELLEPASAFFAEKTIDDYQARNAQQKPQWQQMSGQQAGDPAKLAQALLTIASEPEPPKRFLAGADALTEAERKISLFQQQAQAYPALSAALAHEETAG